MFPSGLVDRVRVHGKEHQNDDTQGEEEIEDGHDEVLVLERAALIAFLARYLWA